MSARKRLDVGSWCPECGPGVGVDEDGLCAYCGATCMGDGADMALAALKGAKTPAEAAVVRAAVRLANRPVDEDWEDSLFPFLRAVRSLQLERSRSKRRGGKK